MKVKVGFTVEDELLRRIDELRGIIKRSTFIEHLLKLGLEVYTQEDDAKPVVKMRR